MRAKDFILENLSNSQVLRYVKKIHPDWSGSVDHSIMNHEAWELINYPISKLQIADPESEDAYIEDPYNRILDVDMDHVMTISQHEIKNKPIVVDLDGYIIDGNHRAMAAKLSGMTHIPAYVPYEEITESLTESIDLQGYTNLLADFGFFITMNTARIHDYAVDQTAIQELKVIQAQFKQPIVNGRTFVEVYNEPAFYKNPKVIPVLLKYVYDMLKYIEPRLQKYLNDEGKSKFLPRIQKIKEQYKQVVQSTQ